MMAVIVTYLSVKTPSISNPKTTASARHIATMSQCTYLLKLSTAYTAVPVTNPEDSNRFSKLSRSAAYVAAQLGSVPDHVPSCDANVPSGFTLMRSCDRLGVNTPFTIVPRCTIAVTEPVGKFNSI